MTDTLKRYHAPASPNSRRVRIVAAEKGIAVPLVAVDLGQGEQHGDAYRAINPRRGMRLSRRVRAWRRSERWRTVCWGCARS